MMIVKIKLDAWAKKKLKNRMGMKMLGGGELSVPELLILSLIEKEDGDTMDLTKEAGKLEKVLNKRS
jgi:pilus assembly protein TadC